MEPLDSELTKQDWSESAEMQQLRLELAKFERTVKNFKFFVFFLAAVHGIPYLLKYFNAGSLSFAIVFPLMFVASGLIFSRSKIIAIVLALITYISESVVNGISSYGYIFVLMIALLFVIQLRAVFKAEKIEKQLEELGAKAMPK